MILSPTESVLWWNIWNIIRQLGTLLTSGTSNNFTTASSPHFNKIINSRWNDLYTPIGNKVAAQLVEQSLLTPELHGLNPVIGKHLYWMFTVNSIEKTKINKKRHGLVHFIKNNWLQSITSTQNFTNSRNQVFVYATAMHHISVNSISIFSAFKFFDEQTIRNPIWSWGRSSWINPTTWKVHYNSIKRPLHTDSR